MRQHRSPSAYRNSRDCKRLPLHRHVFELQIRTETVLPEGSRGEILKARMRDAAHLTLAGMILRGGNSVVLSLVPDSGPDAQLRCVNHPCLSAHTELIIGRA